MSKMMTPAALPLTSKLIDSLHVEAMVLADEARSYFDRMGLAERMALDAKTRVIFSCEALKVTTRLMHGVGWLLAQRANATGDSSQSCARLGRAAETDPEILNSLPFEAQHIVAMSEDLYGRITRIDEQLRHKTRAKTSPAHSLLKELEKAF